jgi:tetratricopeptide (TPR) repeat protein
MAIDSFLEAAWNDHADHPQAVADRIAASLQMVQAAGDVPPFVRLLAHVYGEHLGEWQRGCELLDALRATLGFDASEAATTLLDRNIAALRFAGGDACALDPLSAEDRVCALAIAASALAGRGDLDRAIVAFDRALALGRAGLPPGSAAIRALAVGGNNLAVTLEDKRDRSALETRAMVAAAEAGVTYWIQAGTWLEEERAEYRLARSLLQAGEPHAAVEHATRCMAICESHDAAPLERFFAHAALAMAQRAAGNAARFDDDRRMATHFFEQLAAEDRTWCQADLDQLADRP